MYVEKESLPITSICIIIITRPSASWWWPPPPKAHCAKSKIQFSQLWDLIETWFFYEDIKDVKAISLMMMTPPPTVGYDVVITQNLFQLMDFNNFLTSFADFARNWRKCKKKFNKNFFSWNFFFSKFFQNFFFKKIFFLDFF